MLKAMSTSSLVFEMNALQKTTYQCPYYGDGDCTETERVECLSKMDLLIRGVYLYRGMPLLKLTFVDTEKIRAAAEHSVSLRKQMYLKRTELVRQPNGQLTESDKLKHGSTMFMTREV